MNDLCADIGHTSIIHYGEQLCGDHVEIVTPDDNTTVIVLADGLGSGVKANILSTLTSKIISAMVANGLPLEECVSTVAATLPVCSLRGFAYSTFTVIHLINNKTAEFIQYDNPQVICIRDGRNYDYPTTELNIDGRKIFKTVIPQREGDIYVAMSDGCPHAGMGLTYNFGWKREEIIDYFEMHADAAYTAKTLSQMLIEECDKLYGRMPGDDATACVVRIRKRQTMNLLFGPPYNRDDADNMMHVFFASEGKHIICGGTTSSIAAKYLRKPVKPSLSFVRSDIPPVAEIEGVDLVTEGVITINRVLEYARDYIGQKHLREQWSFQKDAASLICRMLFDEATDINFYVGLAINPAHQNPDLPINFNIKMNLVDELSQCLRKMGKRVNVSYY
ncbi:MAG: serine/threonine-protein phosphatase [Ruminococcaceae bacterium]|nr:serine/threonine-protein phosphatase [Oscillospiraceae bacterium]